MVNSKVNSKLNKGTMWVTWGKKITAIRILDIKQTGILYPDTPLMRFYLDDKIGDIVLERNQKSIRIGNKFYFLNKQDADEKVR